MPQADLGAIALEYRTFGDRANPAIVMIRGLGTQMVEWPDALLDGLASAGFFVVVFDNRDAGLSSDGPEGYGLEDMAADVVGLLDALRLPRAHVFGISLGGMVAQHVAIGFPERVLSLVSVMSSTGNPTLPQAAPDVRDWLTRSAATRAEVIALSTESRRVFGSPGYPESEAERRRAATLAYDRAYRPAGVARQMRAVIADGSRVERLVKVRSPALVIHGADDALIPPEAGRDTARVIPDAELVLVPGMGHNIPVTLAPEIVRIVTGFLRRQRLP
jgi:pimeloyl-ACP methyl ester carboxylesterase